MIETVVIINYFISNTFKFIVGNVNLTQNYFIYSTITVTSIYYFKIRRALRIRYDY